MCTTHTLHTQAFCAAIFEFRKPVGARLESWKDIRESKKEEYLVRYALNVGILIRICL